MTFVAGQFMDSISRLAGASFASPNYIVPTLEESVPDSVFDISVHADSVTDTVSVMQEYPFLDFSRDVASSVVVSGMSGTPQLLSPSGNPFLVLLLLFGFFSFMYVLVARQSYVREVVSDFFFLHDRLSIFVDSSSDSLSSYKLNVIFLFMVSVSTVIYSIVFKSGYLPDVNSEFQYLFLPVVFMVFPALYLLLKSVGLHLLNYIFHGGDMYIRSYFMLLYALGIALYPVSLFLIYSPSTYYVYSLISVSVFVVVYMILVVYKLCQIFLRDMVSFFYIMLYLCTFEIIAILVALKLLLGW